MLDTGLVCSNRQPTVKISSICVAFLENMNFMIVYFFQNDFQRQSSMSRILWIFLKIIFVLEQQLGIFLLLTFFGKLKFLKH